MFPMMGGGGGNNNPQGRDVLADIKDWWDRNGLFTKSLTYITAGFLILSFFTLTLNTFCINSPLLTIFHFQLWRPFTAGFIHKGVIQLLFVYLALLPTCAIQEQQWGTLKMIIDFFVKNFEIHMACSFFFTALSLIMEDRILKTETYGLWCFFMVYLTQRCLQEPDGTSMLCCIPYPIRNKYYPLAFILLFSLLGATRYDMLMGYLVALAHFKYLDEKYHGFLNTARISRWETSVLCSWLQRSPIYISAAGANPTAGQANAGPQTRIASPNQQQQTQQPTGLFAGRGIAIGGSDPNDRNSEAQGIMGRLNKPKKNYNQLDADDDGDEEDDIESQTTDNQSRN